MCMPTQDDDAFLWIAICHREQNIPDRFAAKMGQGIGGRWLAVVKRILGKGGRMDGNKHEGITL